MGVAQVEREGRGPAQLLEMRRQPDEFSFHAEKSAQYPGEETSIEGLVEAARNLL
jgi:hypothetical protein